MPQIEIEYRSMVDKKKNDELLKFLSAHAEKDLGEDDKTTYFFILPDKLLKVVNNLSKRSAKLVLKLNKIGHGSNFEEIEIPISQSDVENSAKMFELLGFTDVQKSFQKRHNFIYSGVEFAIKYSEEWGYHVELEIVVNSLDQKPAAEKKIAAIAKELNLKLMTDEELKKFTKEIDDKYRAERTAKNESRRTSSQ